MVAQEGYEVATARNGADAVGMLHNLSRPALILPDIAMPVMDGVQFLFHLRDRRDRDQHEVVAMSAAVSPAWFQHAPGVIRTLKKPFDVADVLAVLKDFAHCHQLLRVTRRNVRVDVDPNPPLASRTPERMRRKPQGATSTSKSTSKKSPSWIFSTTRRVPAARTKPPKLSPSAW